MSEISIQNTAVNLDGLLEVLGQNLYSDSDVAIRELIQNAADACHRHRPNYQTYTIDGIHPGEEALQILAEKIQAAGYIYHVWSTDRYKLTWTDKDEERTDPAIYIYCLIPSGAENNLNDILNAFNHGLEHPLVWVELAKALNDETLRLKQSEVIEKYGISD